MPTAAHQAPTSVSKPVSILGGQLTSNANTRLQQVRITTFLRILLPGIRKRLRTPKLVVEKKRCAGFCPGFYECRVFSAGMKIVIDKNLEI
jgi:hypothetical protein